ALAENVLGEVLVQLHALEVGVATHQPVHVAPEEADERAVRVGLLVGVLVMPAIDSDPAGRRVLQAADAEDGETVFEPARGLETAMRQQPVITEVDAERAEDVEPGDAYGDAGPVEQPGDESQERGGVEEEEGADVWPDQPVAADGGGVREPLRLKAGFGFRQRGHSGARNSWGGPGRDADAST